MVEGCQSQYVWEQGGAARAEIFFARSGFFHLACQPCYLNNIEKKDIRIYLQVNVVKF